MPDLFVVMLKSGKQLHLYAKGKVEAILAAQELSPGDKILLISKEGEW